MNSYKSGAWNVVCQVCGRKYKSDEVRKRWDGLIVCHNDFENRHILDFLKVREDDPAVPYVSPESTDQFIFVCHFPQTVGMADIGVADCSVADFSVSHFPHERTVPIAGMAVAGCTYPAKDNIYD